MKYIVLILALCFVGCAKGPAKTSYPYCSARVTNGQKSVVCSDGSEFGVTDGTDGTNGDAGVSGSNGYSTGALTQAATADQCVAGGTQVSFYKDYNSDGQLDGDDEVTSQFLVCNGVAGASGTNGTNGTNGSNGTNGTSSTVNVTTANATQCPTGGLAVTTTNGTASSTNVVCNGASGPVGATGPTGSQGPSGYDLDNLSMVQFCSGYTTTYPTSFPEFGECVNGKLYGVYWDSHNAWFAEIVPGYYASTSTSAPCNFTVGLNCAISH